MTEHLRMSGVYWGVAGMALMGRLEEMEPPKVVTWVLSCANADGGFGGTVGHDSHLLYTLSAIQLLAMADALDQLDTEATVKYIAGLQGPDGSFAGDKWGEVDTRFSYCALLACTLLKRRDAIRIDDAVGYVKACLNFDGGFGCVPGAESHAGQIFCCVAALALGESLEAVDAELLGWWLAERQTRGGGLNGRPEKKPDVCYSWWILSSMYVLDKVAWIDSKALVAFILACQDTEDGGIADRPEDMADVYHTFFGLAALALLGDDRVQAIDPVYALPATTVSKLGLKSYLRG